MANFESSTLGQAFWDGRLTLVKNEDERCGSFWPEESVEPEQDVHRPTHLFVGKRTPDDALRRLEEKHGIPFERLIAFRDDKWELEGLRNRAGIHRCMVVDPSGHRSEELLQDFVARAQSRQWLNPPDEIEHPRELLAWLREHRNYA